MLIPGYVRSVLGRNVEQTPKSVLNSMMYCTAPRIYKNEANDPINFISDNDKIQSDTYKSKGNEYFKNKDYESAIIKYTTALNFNPCNHLIFSNRAGCYYLLGNYEEAWGDAYKCLQLEPTFIKGWYRCGCIFDKQKKYGMAAIAYQTAYNLSVNWKDNKTKNTYKSCYDKQMKTIRKQKRSKDIEFVKKFHTPKGRNWIQTAKQKINELAPYAEMNEQYEMKLQKYESDVNFRTLVAHAKYNYFVEKNSFRFHKSRDDQWTISWSAMSGIHWNKRAFFVTINLGHTRCIINYSLIYGMPSSKQIIDLLYQTMTFSNVSNDVCVKPKRIIFSNRFKKQYNAIKKEMDKLKISCRLETKSETKYSCQMNGTRPDGWNYLNE
eukprot:132041_1